MDSLRKANKNTKIRWLFLLLTVIYAITLCHFYFKYIPLIKHFQMILIPILFAAFILTVLNVQWGTLFFVFSFPLINNLPYFFSIYEDIPHAPTALVLFLFYFLGWLVYHTRFNLALSLRQTIFKPIILFSLFILMSGIITFFRYVNFYPFLSDNMYELITNVNGVTSGGAVMSIIFNSLNYLTGFAFFFILLNTVKSKEFVKKILIVLLISTSISISFGFFQHFKDISIGNTQIRVIHNTLNATFKDPLSFGVYLAVMIPLLLGMVFAFKKFVKVIPVIVVIDALLILPYTGSLSGLLGVSVSLLFFLIFLIKISLDLKNSDPKAFRRLIFSIGLFLLLISVVVSSSVLSKNSILFLKLKKRISFLERKEVMTKLSSKARDISSGDMNGDGRDDLLGTWDGQGVYYRNSQTGSWVKMASPADIITAGDIDGDGVDDLIGIWSGQEGVLVKYSSTDSWSKLASTARDIASGDMNGDGRDDLLGTWDGQGVYYRNSQTGSWVKMASPADIITAGDIDGDGVDDLIGIWSGQEGVLVKYSSTDSWSKLASTARDIASGDMNGDGRDDLLGTWDGQGVYYRNSQTGSLVKMASPAHSIASGDINGNGINNLIGIWNDQEGVLVMNTSTRDWSLFTSNRLFYFWEMAGSMVRDYPFSGVGVGAYIIELPNYAEFYKKKGRTADSAENYFFQVGSELGILALFFSFWIFWEIFKQMRKTFKINLSTDRWNYLSIGILSGIISFFVNFLLHTYIGSYEIKYTFWLLVALIFCLRRSKKEQEEKILFSKNFKILCVVLIVFFSGVHLWNSTHSLSLKSRTEQFGLKQDFGLDKIEKTNEGREFRWTRGYGGMTIKIEKPVIEIPLLASHPDIQKNPVKVKIFLIKDFFKQKRLLDEIILAKSIWETYEYHIQEEVNQEVILLFKVSRTWNPLKTLGTPDPRNLGIAIGKIQFKLKE